MSPLVALWQCQLVVAEGNIHRELFSCVQMQVFFQCTLRWTLMVWDETQQVADGMHAVVTVRMNLNDRQSKYQKKSEKNSAS